MKNIEKFYGLQINIREQIDAEHLSFYKEVLERVMRFVTFDINDYYVYVHFLTIKELKNKSYFGRNIPLNERIQEITLIYKVNPKQRKKMAFMNEFGDFNYSQGVEQIPQENQVQFNFKSAHIKEGTLETKLITFLKKDFIRPDHFKIKLEVRPYPTIEFEERLKQGRNKVLSPRKKRLMQNKRTKNSINGEKKEKIDKSDTFTGFDLYFSKQIKFTIPQLLASIDEKKRENNKNNIPIDDFISKNLTLIETTMSENWNIIKKKNIGEYELMMIKIREWLNNFSSNEYELALKIMQKLKLISTNDIDNMVRVASDTIKTILKNNFENIYFFGMGESPSDSGSQFLYSIRKSLAISENKFPKELKNIQTLNPTKLFFFDDIIGTGNQAISFYDKYLRDLNIDCYYCVLVGFKKGIDNIEKKSGFKKIIPSLKLGDEEKAFSSNSMHFKDTEERRKIKTFAKKYGNKLYPKGPLGYEGSQALIIFQHNVPNNTLPIIWAGPSNEKEPSEPWSPLFERKKI